MFSRLFQRFRPAHSPSRVLCVLGMHRSGTSCLTGIVESWGVDLGEVSRQNRANAKGNQENQAIMDLHEALLAANGGSWFAPPEQMLWSEQHRKTRDRIIRRFSCKPCWGFKDPRTVLAFEGWKEALPAMECVGIFRNPVAVARSLQARGPQRFTDLEKGYDVWAAYNRRLLAIHAQQPFPVISFDAPPEEFLAKVETVRGELGFPAPATAESFFEESLRHQDATAAPPLPSAIADLYAELCRLAR